MSKAIAELAAHILVVEPSTSQRALMSECLSHLGFATIQGIGSLLDAKAYIEQHDDIDWIILPLLSNEKFTAYHFLHELLQQRRFQRIKASVFYSEDELEVVPLVFALGAISCHPKTGIKEGIMTEFSCFIELCKLTPLLPALVSLNFLIPTLKKLKLYEELHSLCLSALQLFPGNVQVLLDLADSCFFVNQADKAARLLPQARLLSAKDDEKVARLAEKLRLDGITIEALETENILGIQKCIVIDPDTDVLSACDDLLTALGVPSVVVFENGKEAYDYCMAEGEPDLILMEWRILGISGPMLIQRLRQNGFFKACIMVISSLIKKEESVILREMGVSTVLAKPFEKQQLIENIVWTLQQNKVEIEHRSFERRIRRALAQGKLDEAEGILEIFSHIPFVTAGTCVELEAEIAYAHGDYNASAKLALEALKALPDNLPALTTLGSAFLKLGDSLNALKCFEKAQKISPSNIERLCKMAEIEHTLDEPARVQEHLAAAEKLDPTSPVLATTKATLAVLEGNTVLAGELIGQLDSAKQLVSALNNRAVALAQSERYDEAHKVYLDALASVPLSNAELRATVFFNLALCYARSERLVNAEDALKSAVAEGNTRLTPKIRSLLVRVSAANKNGTKVELNVSHTENLSEEARRDQAVKIWTRSKAIDSTSRKALAVAAGQYCLHGILVLRGQLLEKLKKALE